MSRRRLREPLRAPGDLHPLLPEMDSAPTPGDQ